MLTTSQRTKIYKKLQVVAVSKRSSEELLTILEMWKRSTFDIVYAFVYNKQKIQLK